MPIRKPNEIPLTISAKEMYSGGVNAVRSLIEEYTSLIPFERESGNWRKVVKPGMVISVPIDRRLVWVIPSHPNSISQSAGLELEATRMVGPVRETPILLSPVGHALPFVECGTLALPGAKSSLPIECVHSLNEIGPAVCGSLGKGKRTLMASYFSLADRGRAYRFAFSCPTADNPYTEPSVTIPIADIAACRNSWDWSRLRDRIIESLEIDLAVQLIQGKGLV